MEGPACRSSIKKIEIPVKKPLHYVLDKIEQGVYRRDAAPLIAPSFRGSTNSEIDLNDPQSFLGAHEGEEIELLE